jgi:hypothetical protein
MQANQKRSIAFIFLILFIGIITSTILGQMIGGILPDGVVKEFFLTSRSIGWGSQPDNWFDLYVFRFKTGMFVDISVVSLIGMVISWYFLRYFK